MSAPRAQFRFVLGVFLFSVHAMDCFSVIYPLVFIGVSLSIGQSPLDVYLILSHVYLEYIFVSNNLHLRSFLVLFFPLCFDFLQGESECKSSRVRGEGEKGSCMSIKNEFLFFDW